MAGRPKGGEKLGGRAKGTPNKSRETVLEIAENIGVNPFEVLCMFAAADWEGLGYNSPVRTIVDQYGREHFVDVIEPTHRLQAAKEAAQYLYPKRKALEVSGAGGGLLEIYLSMSPEERERRLKELEQRNK